MAAPKPRHTKEQLAGVVQDLERAGVALAEGEWYPANTFNLDADWRRLDLWSDEDRLDALRRAAGEVSLDDFDPPPPPSRSGEPACKGALMRAFVWTSASFNLRMYFKFAFHRGYLYIFSLHPADF